MPALVPRRRLAALLALACGVTRHAWAADGAIAPGQGGEAAEGEALPAWRRFALPAPLADGRPALVFIIDDMGLNRVQSARAAALPGPLTLSWMPYALDLGGQVAAGRAAGHETMLHMPMQPIGHADPGPDALRPGLPASVNLARLVKALDAVPGAVALNQHEGSAASRSAPLMELVMGELHARGMGFVDSMTIAHSLGLRSALAAGVPAVTRDVFLDNSPDPAAIRAQLAATEEVAARAGLAVAIGHPRVATLDALERYLPEASGRGFALWPVSAALAARNPLALSVAG